MLNLDISVIIILANIYLLLVAQLGVYKTLKSHYFYNISFLGQHLTGLKFCVLNRIIFNPIKSTHRIDIDLFQLIDGFVEM